MRLLSLLLALVPFAASAADLAVEVTNASEPVLCAEKDNVTINLASNEVRRFRIEAVHPAYAGALSDDSFEADFTGCPQELSRETTEVQPPKRVTLLRGRRDLAGRLHLPQLLAPARHPVPHRRPRRERLAPRCRCGCGATSAPRRCWCSIRRTATGACARCRRSISAGAPTAPRSWSGRSRSRGGRS